MSPACLTEKLVCQDDDAFELFRDLALREGLFCGLSSGAALWGAMEAAKGHGARLDCGGAVCRPRRPLSLNRGVPVCLRPVPAVSVPA